MKKDIDEIKNFDNSTTLSVSGILPKLPLVELTPR